MSFIESLSVGGTLAGALMRPDGATIDTADNLMMLYVFIHKPSSPERRNLSSRAPLTVGLCKEGATLFFIVKFGDGNGQMCFDAPYSAALYPTPISAEELGNALYIIAADTAIGKILDLRLVGLSQEFADILRSEIAEQLRTQTTRAQYDSDIKRAYAKYRLPDDMLKDAIVVCRIEKMNR